MRAGIEELQVPVLNTWTYSLEDGTRRVRAVVQLTPDTDPDMAPLAIVNLDRVAEMLEAEALLASPPTPEGAAMHRVRTETNVNNEIPSFVTTRRNQPEIKVRRTGSVIVRRLPDTAPQHSISQSSTTSQLSALHDTTASPRQGLKRRLTGSTCHDLELALASLIIPDENGMEVDEISLASIDIDNMTDYMKEKFAPGN